MFLILLDLFVCGILGLLELRRFRGLRRLCFVGRFGLIGNLEGCSYLLGRGIVRCLVLRSLRLQVGLVC